MAISEVLADLSTSAAGFQALPLAQDTWFTWWQGLLLLVVVGLVIMLYIFKNRQV